MTGQPRVPGSAWRPLKSDKTEQKGSHTICHISPKTSFPSNMIGLYLYLLEISGNHQDSSTPEVRMPSSFTSSPGPRPCRPSWSLASEHQYAQGQCQWRLHTPVDWDTFNHLFSRGFSGFNKTPRKTFVESVHSTSSYPNHENRKRSASQSRTARTTLSNMFREQCIHHGITVYRASNADPKQNHQYSLIRLAEHLAIAGTAPSATSKNPTPGICFPSWPSIWWTFSKAGDVPWHSGTQPASPRKRFSQNCRPGHLSEIPKSKAPRHLNLHNMRKLHQ